MSELEKYYDEITGDYLFVRPKPFAIQNVFEEEYFNELKKYLYNKKEDREGFVYDANFGRTTYHSSRANENEIFVESARKLVPKAKELFNSEKLDFSYCLFSIYKGNRANLYYHVDDNACTYTIDLCIHQNTPWPLHVVDQEFVLDENEAVCYYGEDQYHWREKFPDPKNNEVAMIFYHFVDSDHWFFSGKQDSHSDIIERRRGSMERYYQNRNILK